MMNKEIRVVAKLVVQRNQTHKFIEEFKELVNQK